MGILINLRSNVIRDFHNDTTKHYVARNGDFDIALALIQYPSGEIGDNLLADPTYFTVFFDNPEYRRTAGNYTITHRPIQTAYCNDTFSYNEAEFYELKKMSKYLCPIHKDYFLQGDFNSEVFSDVEVLIYKCVNSTLNNNHWKTPQQISDAVNYGYLDIALVHSYFDFDDYENPIKRYVGATELMFMNEDYTQQFKTLIQYNTVLDSDNRFYKGSFK